ncbi:MAG: response regulator transcription factor [Clostridia bacterium]|nr:response regulator transcription factor [Clostridia bacterium]
MADWVLMVDDDEAVLATLQRAVRASGMECDAAQSAEQALEMTRGRAYDLIIMDINLGRTDGFEAIRVLRDRGVRTPIMIVSGRLEDVDAVYGLGIGADDYVTKPFNPITLCAKIKALIRRSRDAVGDGQQLCAGPFRYDMRTLRLYKEGEEISLSSKENAIMKLFIDNVGRIFTRDMLYEMVWGDVLVDEGVVAVYINRLRQKIEEDPTHPRYLLTARGLGYRFVV